MEKVRKAFLGVARVCAIVAGFMVFLGVFIVVINSLSRSFFDKSFLWCDELVQYLAVEACFLGTPYLLMKDSQLSVGVLSSIIKSKLVLKIIRAVFLVAEIVLFAMFARYCITAMESLAKSGMLLNTIPMAKVWLYYFLEGTFGLSLVMLLSTLILNKGGFYHE